MAFLQNEQSKTFISEVQRLMNAGVVKKYKEIADAIEWDKTAISNVMNGRRDIPLEKYLKFTEVYKVPKTDTSGTDVYKEKYYFLLEQRIKERDNLDAMLREFASKIATFERSHKELNLSLNKLQHDLLVQTAMTTAYQEWTIEHTGAGNSRTVMNSIRKKAVLLLTSFEQKGIGADMGIVSNGKRT